MNSLQVSLSNMSRKTASLLCANLMYLIMYWSVPTVGTKKESRNSFKSFKVLLTMSPSRSQVLTILRFEWTTGWVSNFTIKRWIGSDRRRIAMSRTHRVCPEFRSIGRNARCLTRISKSTFRRKWSRSKYCMMMRMKTRVRISERMMFRLFRSFRTR